MSKELTEFFHFEKGFSPSALQRKYKLTYVHGVELAEYIQALKDHLADANYIIESMKPFIQGSMDRKTFMKILDYENKWGVK